MIIKIFLLNSLELIIGTDSNYRSQNNVNYNRNDSDYDEFMDNRSPDNLLSAFSYAGAKGIRRP